MKMKKFIIPAVIVLILQGFALSIYANIFGNTTADITFESGNLTLVEMSSFSFGKYTISAESKTYPAVESTVFLDVRDLRGTGKGWKVTALASRFNSGETSTLSGASISLINGTATSTMPDGSAPNVAQGIKIDCDGAASTHIATAAADHGLGVWNIEWNGNEKNNTNATLNIPGGIATVGTHTATIVWTLAATP